MHDEFGSSLQNRIWTGSPSHRFMNLINYDWVYDKLANRIIISC